MLVLNVFPAISEGLNLKIFPGSISPDPSPLPCQVPHANAFKESQPNCYAIQSQTTKAPPTQRLTPQVSFGPSPRWIAPALKKNLATGLLPLFDSQQKLQNRAARVLTFSRYDADGNRLFTQLY